MRSALEEAKKEKAEADREKMGPQFQTDKPSSV